MPCSGIECGLHLKWGLDHLGCHCILVSGRDKRSVHIKDVIWLWLRDGTVWEVPSGCPGAFS